MKGSPSHSNLTLWEFNSSTSQDKALKRWKNFHAFFFDTHLGGHKTSSRNSSILFTSVLTSLLKVINGGWVPGAKFCRSTGFLLEKNSGQIGQKVYQVIKQRESKIQLLVLTWHSEASGVLFDPQRLILQMLYKHLTFQELQCEINDTELIGKG